MKEVTGRILSWDGVSQQGMIEPTFPISTLQGVGGISYQPVQSVRQRSSRPLPQLPGSSLHPRTLSPT